MPANPPTVISIFPNTITKRDSGPAEQVVISGHNFAQGATAALKDHPLAIEDITENTITASVPVTLPVSMYHLTVTNPDTLPARLPRAFRVIEDQTPGMVLGFPGLVTFGPTMPQDSGDDGVQVIFFEIPDTTPDDIYIHIFDADTGGFWDRPKGGDGWTTAIEFRIYGGAGAYSHPDAQSPRPGINGKTSGTMLASQPFTESVGIDDRWYPFGPFSAAQGEHLSGRYLFKLVVEGTAGNDGNLYYVAISTEEASRVAPAGARIFAFSWTFDLETVLGRRVTGLYPYVPGDTTTFTQYNHGFDYSGGDMLIRTPAGALVASGSAISQGGEQSSSFDLLTAFQADETGTGWAVDFTTLSSEPGNDVTFWSTTGQDGAALAIFTQLYAWGPP